MARSDATTVSGSGFGGELLAEEQNSINSSGNNNSNTILDHDSSHATEPSMAPEVCPNFSPGQQPAAAVTAATSHLRGDKREYDIESKHQVRTINEEGGNVSGHQGMSGRVSSRTLSSSGVGMGTMSSADRGPFSIVPGFAVVPANGEVSFEVAFSPSSLGETR